MYQLACTCLIYFVIAGNITCAQSLIEIDERKLSDPSFNHPLEENFGMIHSQGANIQMKVLKRC